MKNLSLPFFRKRIPMVNRAPAKNGEFVPLKVSRMTLHHVRWWHSQVQPVIDKMSNRADKHWNWILIAASSNFFGKFLARRPAGITIGIENKNHYIPLVLMQLIGKFPYFIDKRKKCVFLWYLSVAPDEALLKLKNVELDKNKLPKRLGSIALDIAVTHSMNNYRKGRTSLHAAIEGGDNLLQWYIKRGMNVFPKEEKLHFGIRRILFPSDGRYCYFTEDGAQIALGEFNSLR